MKAAFKTAILATAFFTISAIAAPKNITIKSIKLPLEKIDIFAAKELHWLSKNIGNEKITLLVDHGYLENEGKGLQYVKIEIPEKKLAYVYNSAGSLITQEQIISQVKQGIIEIIDNLE